MATKKKRKRIVSDDQKSAMAEGRAQSRAISPYLEALEAYRPKRGRKRTPESIDRRLQAIDNELESANQIKRLSLVQERLDCVDGQGSTANELAELRVDCSKVFVIRDAERELELLISPSSFKNY